MDFLNRLYESNYFGIGLFAVISFLVVTFLVVLFFGKKDEQKRKLDDNTNSYAVPGINDEPAFRETSVPTPVEVPAPSVQPVEPVQTVAPVSLEQDVPSVVPMPNFEVPVNTPIAPVQPIQYEEPVTPVNNVVEPVVNKEIVSNVEPVAPVIPQDVNNFTVPVTPVVNTPIEPVKFEVPVQNVEPTVIEPVKIDIPTEPTVVTPIINEEVKPVLPKVEEPTIIEEPVIGGSYYKPVNNVSAEEVKMPNIDFDALAKTISAELDELEKSNSAKVTPISDITNNNGGDEFSPVYVNKAVNRTSSGSVDLAKKIDLPTKKD